MAGNTDADNTDAGTGRGPSRRRFLSLAALAAAAGAGSLAGCSTKLKNNSGGTSTGGPDAGGNPVGKGRKGVSGDTLFIAGFQWGPPNNFNPLGASPAWPGGFGNMQLIYESLVRFNLLNGKLDPGLGTGIEQVDNTTLKIPLQKGATFSDGKPLTVDDVVFTFELAKRNKDLSYATLWNYVDDVSAEGEAVVFKLNKKQLNPNNVKSTIAGIGILPKHIWEPIEKAGGLSKETNLKPIGSGPYTIETADQTQVVLKRVDNYWGNDLFGGQPQPLKVVHPIFKDNQGGDLAFEKGTIDVSQQFTPQIWKMWENKNVPASTWSKKPPYHLPGSIPWLQINIKKKGLDNVKVRRALAYAINYKQIADTAMSKYSIPCKASVILPSGAEQKYFDAAGVEANGWSYNPDKAVEILEKELKCTKGSDGIYSLPDGTRLGQWTAQTPTGWSDWQAALQVVASSAKAVGIDIKTYFPQAPNVTTAMQNGNFDLACWYFSGVAANSPWNRFRDMMDIRGVADVGKTAYWDYNRFSHADVPALLDAAGATTDDAKLKDVYAKLDNIYRQTIPAIGLMYRPLEFYEFNQTNWEGFPDEKNPFAPPQFSGAGIEWLFKLKKVAAS
jgi:peptide/nickel transport system substrate-binding protein